MSLFTSIKKRYAQITPKQFIVAGVFMLGLAGAIGGGFASKQHSAAQEIRDCDNGQSIINVAPCGALTREELASDIRSNNSIQKDLQAIYADSRIGGLSGEADYRRLETEAVHGVLKRNGDVVVNGEVVMTGAYTMGRKNYAGREPLTIGNRTYYMSTPEVSFASHRTELDVIVLFDDNGTVEIAIMEACGNALPKGYRVPSGAECKGLNKFAVENKKNTYQFSAEASKFGFAKYVKFNYYYNDGSGYKLFDTKTNPSDKTKEITFTKATKVKVEIEISLPGNKSKTVTSPLCEKEIGVVQEEFLYVCEALVATARDNTNRKFRFTAKHKKSNNVTLNSVDFTLDNTTTTKGVTDKDANGYIYKDYDFNDSVEHKVSAVINFTADGKPVTSKETCVAKVTPEKPPVCIYNPNLPPEHPDCKKPECIEKPGSGFPPGDERCKELPKTGAGSVAGLFAGVAVAGTIGHRLYTSRKRR